MANRSVKRLPEVKTLYELLPKGAEGGREFARVVDLLLFQEARRDGKKISLFSDVAGDYYGLDSFEGDVFRKEGTRGYQYKFYPSPLSNAHRKEIANSLKTAASRQKELKLKRWILVTPQDLLESATRKERGDLTWFESLRSDLNLQFEIEHWGHKKLLSLFLQTPSLCLFYYPELTANDSARKTIEDTRRRYDDNLTTLYRNIEFVGMSVYKQEATKGVPMEHIYIPLAAIPETADERDSSVPRVDPLRFLEPGGRRIVLGDPGSGKSTLLRFLALVGTSRALQKRCNAKPDKRLPILITLRRYADELKTRRQLPLIDYIQECVQADFTLKSADLSFFEYYLETGQAVLLFDGLDELPTPHFKQMVRDRIRTLVTTYPGNTVVVTSRIVGYESSLRFSEKEFGHLRITKLQIAEMKAFVKDWYEARIENLQEREANAQDLIRILETEGNTAIRELAENPLLLTIVALVHRIDAVLPDERVVLYQKCTETLLNTWHTWKYRGTEVKNRGREERRNRRRMEAIANWMHSQSIGVGKDQRAVVPYFDLHKFLTDYITEVENPYDPDNDPEDVACDFLEFVKKRAGLLIEVGDERYSFVHQTFQEYLTASYMATTNEGSGVEGLWRTIKSRCIDPRWTEVIRLLVADLNSTSNQRVIVEKLLALKDKKGSSKPLLLTGLLIDGVEPAELHVQQIMEQLITLLSNSKEESHFRTVLNMLRTWLSKDTTDEQVVKDTLQQLVIKAKQSQDLLRLLLIACSLGWPEFVIKAQKNPLLSEENVDLLRLFTLPNVPQVRLDRVQSGFEALWDVQNYLSLLSPQGNLIAAMSEALTSSLSAGVKARRRFEEQLVLLAVDFYGPFTDFNYNLFSLGCSGRSIDCETIVDTESDFSILNDKNPRLHRFVTALHAFHRTEKEGAISLAKQRAFSIGQTSKALLEPHNFDRQPVLFLRLTDQRWDDILASPKFCSDVLDIILFCFKVESFPHWKEAARVGFLPTIPKRLEGLFSLERVKGLEKHLRMSKPTQEAIYDSARLLLFDCWLSSLGRRQRQLERLARLAENVEAPALRIALSIRALFFRDRSQKPQLATMVDSFDSTYRQIFESCLWRVPQRNDRSRASKSRGPIRATKVGARPRKG
jgi:NACHT domain